MIRRLANDKGTRSELLSLCRTATAARQANLFVREFVSGSISTPLSFPVIQVWGCNTDVGKTLVSAGILNEACKHGKALFIKPVQTGFPEDSDARLVGAVTGCQLSVGEHAAQLLEATSSNSRSLYPNVDASSPAVHTEYAWRTAVSPHLAVQLEGRGVGDSELLESLSTKLSGFARGKGMKEASLALVETAGGPGSPGPSGSLQCNLFRALRLPALLVGDGRLGGISTTLAAYEMLSHRGYDIAAVALMESPTGPNTAAIQESLPSCDGAAVLVFRLPECNPPKKRDPAVLVDVELEQWLRDAEPQLAELYRSLQAHHTRRVDRLQALPAQTLASIWYPFTQHTGLQPKDVTVIDARSGEDMLVFKSGDGQDGLDRIEPHFDACASWWTQGMTGQLHGRLVRETMKGVARYGHVIHPHTAIEPTLKLSNMLLGSVGKGWASRAYYSDDGSTAIEIALKMAFRKFWKDNPNLRLEKTAEVPACELRVVGIDGGYHGDTLGAMDAVAPSPYNGPAQFPWYKGRGLFLVAPYVGLVKGRWQVKGSSSGKDSMTWRSVDEMLQASDSRPATQEAYSRQITRAIDKYEMECKKEGVDVRVAACILEPMLQGAGGMLFVDPLYQKCLVRVARSRGIPIIFDEVFSGLWRLGRVSAAELLGEQPDIACYAKLLTGGLLPLSVTLATDAVYQAFQGESKLDALLHGHSYSGHAAGASAGVAALSIFADPTLNPALQPSGGRLKEMWRSDLLNHISYLPNVDSVVALGTVIAVELRTEDGGGYASGASARVAKELRSRNVFVRPLGSTVYLMVTPTTSPITADRLLQTLVSVLEA